jgi:hypothetical protein
MKRHAVLTLGILSLLAIVSACKDPVKPIEEPLQERRDTIHSFARAEVHTPSMNAVWEVRTPDTLWNGVSIVRASNGTTSTREQYAIRNYISTAHIIGQVDAAATINIKSYSDLTKQYYLYYDYSAFDTLRSWKSVELTCNFSSPKEIRPPVTLTQDSVFQFQWLETNWSEQVVPVSNRGVTNWVIRSLFSNILSAKFSRGSTAFIENRSQIINASLTIEKYDAFKRRMSGRFSFKVIGSLKNEMIEIQNGVFENAYMRMR